MGPRVGDSTDGFTVGQRSWHEPGAVSADLGPLKPASFLRAQKKSVVTCSGVQVTTDF